LRDGRKGGNMRLQKAVMISIHPFYRIESFARMPMLRLTSARFARLSRF
jgi:hypothetical protein